MGVDHPPFEIPIISESYRTFSVGFSAPRIFLNRTLTGRAEKMPNNKQRLDLSGKLSPLVAPMHTEWLLS